jgi:hypothetical protein
VRGETKSRVAMSLLASPSLTSRTTSRSAGGQRRRPAGGSFAFAAAALGAFAHPNGGIADDCLLSKTLKAQI